MSYRKRLVGIQIAVVSFVLPAMGPVVSEARAAPLTLEEVKALRKEAARKKRRIVFHSDGMHMDPKKDRHEGYNANVFPYLPGSQTDACTYSLVHQFPVVRLYRSKVGQEWPPGVIQEMYGNGPDGLQVYIDFCRKNGYEAFWAMRANDTHDVRNKQLRWESNKWKQEHPEYLVGSPDKRPPFGGWTAFDYSHPEVREKVFQLFEEVAANYEVDGMMLDFFRHLCFFRSTAWGGNATREETEMMTGLLRRIRAALDAAGARRGRPILFAVRTPDSFGYCKGLGLDVERWMREDLIDVWIATGYFRLQEWEETVALGHRFGVQVWASLDDARVVGGGPDARRTSLYSSTESYRARAMNAWRGGVDSLYLFNFFYLPGTPQFSLLQEIGDPARLAWLDKMYVADARGRANAGRALKGGERFFTRPQTFTPVHPLTLKPGQSTAVNLLVGDDVGTAASRGLEARLALEIETAGLRTGNDLAVSLNGRALKDGHVSNNTLAFVVDPTFARSGPNRITIALGAERSAEAILRDLRLWIRYHKKADRH